MNKNALARYIDQTTLKPGMTESFITQFCQDAKENHFASVCIMPNMIETAAKVLAGSETKVCTVISFPLGFDAPEVKIFETEDALAKGAQEIDLVMNVSALKAGLYGTVDAELEGVVKASHDKGAIVKLIIETPLLTEEQIVKACELAEKNNVDIVKTSTGFSAMLSRSTSVDDVKLIRRSVRPETGVKAAGGIRTTEDTLAMIEAGATRIGASAGEAILNGLIE